MSAAIQIRPMQAGDVDQVAAMAAELPQAPQWPRTAYEAAIDPTAIPHRVCLVADGPGQPLAGFVVASVVGFQAEIEAIGVAPELQRQGIGRTLLDALVAEVRKRRVTEVLLEVRESNAAAAALYRAAGFVLTGRRPEYYSGPAEDALLFSRELEQETQTANLRG